MRSGFVKALVVMWIPACSLFTADAQATATNQLYRVGPADVSCVIQAAIKHGVPANILLALSSVEGGKNGQFVLNKNGSYDMGHFQINTIHFSGGEVFGKIDKNDAAWRGCFNAELAAMLLQKRLTAPGTADYWVRVANYHSATPKYNAIYRSKLIPLAARWGKWLQVNYQTSVSYN